MVPEGEAQAQAEAQAPAGAEQQVDAESQRAQIRAEVRADLLKEIKPEYEQQIASWKKKYGDESNAWGAKFKAQEQTLADLRAQVEAAKLTEEGADFARHRRGVDARAAQLDEREAILNRREIELRADATLAGIRRRPWGARVPEEWYGRAKERLLAGEVSVTAELTWEAEDLALKVPAVPSNVPTASSTGPATAGLRSSGQPSATVATLLKEDISNYGPKELLEYKRRWDKAMASG